MPFPFDTGHALKLVSEALLAELGDEVDLIFRYGSALRGNTHRYSDLDVSYVPAHESTAVAITVLVQDVMIDLYPIRWSALERMARYESVHCTVLGESAILYARNTAVRDRFQALGDALQARLRPEARPEMVARAMTIFQGAAWPAYLLRQAAAREQQAAAVQQAQTAVRIVLHCLAVLNQRCIDTRKLAQVLALPLLPPGLEEQMGRIMNTAVPAELQHEVEALMDATRDLLLAEQRRLRRPPRPLAEVYGPLYPELKADIQHLILACERGDAFNFNMMSLLHELQLHLAWAQEGVAYGEFNTVADYAQNLATLGFPDLLAAYAAGNRPALAAAARRFDARLRDFLSQNGVPLYDFASLAELEAYLADWGQ